MIFKATRLKIISKKPVKIAKKCNFFEPAAF
jgi:hypothetical protein